MISVVNKRRRAIGNEMAGNGSADSARRAGDKSEFVFEL
jgi:hypothetical protein